MDSGIVLENNAESCSSLEAIAENCDEPVAKIDCSQEEIVLTTQAEVDAFDCTTVKSLTINALANDDPITSLEGLRSLTAIEGNLRIEAESSQLTSLEGLNNLRTVGNNINYFGNLPNLVGLNGLKTIGGSLTVEYQAGLKTSLV